MRRASGDYSDLQTHTHTACDARKERSVRRGSAGAKENLWLLAGWLAGFRRAGAGRKIQPCTRGWAMQHAYFRKRRKNGVHGL